MAMVDTVYWLPGLLGGIVARASWLGSKVSGCLAPCCILHLNRVNCHKSQWFCHDDSKINIVLSFYYW